MDERSGPASAVGVVTQAADVVGKNYNRPVEMIVLSALIYFAICFSLSLAVRQLQKRVAIVR